MRTAKILAGIVAGVAALMVLFLPAGVLAVLTLWTMVEESRSSDPHARRRQQWDDAMAHPPADELDNEASEHQSTVAGADPQLHSPPTSLE